jgi:hypothetical protein
MLLYSTSLLLTPSYRNGRCQSRKVWQRDASYFITLGATGDNVRGLIGSSPHI